jgi:hypothetical protein
MVVVNLKIEFIDQIVQTTGLQTKQRRDSLDDFTPEALIKVYCGQRYLTDTKTPQLMGEEGLEVKKSEIVDIENPELSCLLGQQPVV